MLSRGSRADLLHKNDESTILWTPHIVFLGPGPRDPEKVGASFPRTQRMGITAMFHHETLRHLTETLVFVFKAITTPELANHVTE